MALTEYSRLIQPPRIIVTTYHDRDLESVVSRTRDGAYMYLITLYVSSFLLIYLILRTFDAIMGAVVGMGIIMVRYSNGVSCALLKKSSVPGFVDSLRLGWHMNGKLTGVWVYKRLVTEVAHSFERVRNDLA